MHLHSFLLILFLVCYLSDSLQSVSGLWNTLTKLKPRLKAADVLNWLEDNITKEDIENSYTGDIQEEMKYFNRTAYVKEQLTVQFTELSDEEAENFSEQFVEKMFN